MTGEITIGFKFPKGITRKIVKAKMQMFAAFAEQAMKKDMGSQTLEKDPMWQALGAESVFIKEVK